MDNSIYLTLSRQMAMLRDLEVTSNNMANSNTTAYQTSHTMFDSYMVQDNGRGKMAFAHDISTYRNLEQGSLTATGNTLDFAINGDGYFVVQTPAGVRYTRGGNFKIDTSGTLVTQDNYPILDPGAQTIRFNPDDKNITIGAMGNISVNGEQRGFIDLVSFANQQNMKKLGDRLFTTDATPQPALNARVVQGALEGSNVQPVLEMTHLLDITHSVEESGKIIQIVYDLESKAAQGWTQ